LRDSEEKINVSAKLLQKEGDTLFLFLFFFIRHHNINIIIRTHSALASNESEKTQQNRFMIASMMMMIL
jgi:hypothetical protein